MLILYKATYFHYNGGVSITHVFLVDGNSFCNKHFRLSYIKDCHRKWSHSTQDIWQNRKHLIQECQLSDIVTKGKEKITTEVSLWIFILATIISVSGSITTDWLWRSVSYHFSNRNFVWGFTMLRETENHQILGASSLSLQVSFYWMMLWEVSCLGF
jgi:hypothetical protein